LNLQGTLDISKEVRVLHYKCRTEDELRLLYADTDGGIKRNQREKKMALLAGSAGFEGIPQGTLNLITEGYALYRWTDPKERRKNNNPDQIAEAIKAGKSDNELCSAVAHFLVDHAQGHKLTFVKTDSVVAAMLATFQVDQEAAKTFWLSVFSGANLSESDPRLLLSRWLLESKAKAKSKDGTKDTKEDVLLMCLAAWNPWRRNRKIDVLKMPRGRKRPELV
jgi:hypothetical protein